MRLMYGARRELNMILGLFKHLQCMVLIMHSAAQIMTYLREGFTWNPKAPLTVARLALEKADRQTLRLHMDSDGCAVRVCDRGIEGPPKGTIYGLVRDSIGLYIRNERKMDATI